MPGDANSPKALKSKVELVKRQRRQNTSCDRCRRSKRRCTVSPSVDGVSSKVCTNCKRLGHQCTFEFAEYQSTSVSNKRQKRQNNHPDGSAQRTWLSDYDRTIIGAADSPSNAFDATFLTEQEVLSSWLNIDFDGYLEGTPSFATNLEPSIPSSEPHSKGTSMANDGPETQLTLQSTGFPIINTSGSSHFFPKIGLSFNSPIHLLNSGIDVKILGDRLTRIYEAIATASCSRFLDYDCNLYASRNRYRIGDSESGSSIGSVPAISNVDPQATSSSHGILIPAHDEFGQEISLLGSVRFLDHFADLYGNRLGLTARKKSDEVLKAVLRVFSMQWLPSTPSTAEPTFLSGGPFLNQDTRQSGNENTLDSFVDAWVRARSLLNDAHNVRSFRVILATITFVGIVTPMKIVENEGFLPTGLLDTGLQKLAHLDRLVTSYCANLGPSSIYGSLAETSLNIIRWAGYIRDTGAALSMNHKSKLPDQWGPSKAVPNKEAMAVWATCRNIVELNMNVQAICRKASAETMCIWRQIIKIKTSANQPQGTDNQQSLSTIEAINLAVAAINEFNETYQAFILHCINNFSCLSTCPRISIVSHVMFWNLGIFLLVDVFQSAIKDLDDSIARQTGPIIRKFQQDAVSCVAQAVERVLHLPAEEAFNLQNGFGAEVPITAYHVTPSLAVTALQKAIESVINLCLPWTNQSGLTPADGQVLIPDGIWDRQIDILMKGLMSLDVTIGGSQTSVLALRELMKKHGDIVSECWTSGFDT